MLTNIVVFSKDRPMQLDCTLRSIEKNAKPDFLTVIYKATNSEYEEGYRQIKANLIKETNFRQNVLDSIKGDYTMFLTDDDIVFKKIKFEEFPDDVVCFSYRLGLNIDFCYSNNKPNKLKNYKDGDFLEWDWSKEELDFAYPMSVTAHLFKSDYIRKQTEKVNFSNPNVFEGVLQTVGDVPPLMRSYKESCIVGVPANRVNDVTSNRNGETYSYPTKELNDLFLRGMRIDWESMEFKINAAQQELKYVLVG